MGEVAVAVEVEIEVEIAGSTSRRWRMPFLAAAGRALPLIAMPLCALFEKRLALKRREKMGESLKRAQPLASWRDPGG